MFDAIVHHLSPDVFLVSLVGHLVVESSVKAALHSARYLIYLAAVMMIPILMQVVLHHEKVGAVPKVPRKRSQRRCKPTQTRT